MSVGLLDEFRDVFSPAANLGPVQFMNFAKRLDGSAARDVDVQTVQVCQLFAIADYTTNHS